MPGARCYSSGSVEDVTVDHLTPRSEGGSNRMENLAVCCRRCKGRKAGRTVDEWISDQASWLGSASLAWRVDRVVSRVIASPNSDLILAQFWLHIHDDRIIVGERVERI